MAGTQSSILTPISLPKHSQIRPQEILRSYMTLATPAQPL
jgi:hypothetical protein